MKKLLFRAAVGIGTLGVIVGGAAAFSAFEAHIINVTARIENALSVNEGPIEFGTVFPQELLVHDLHVVMSDSFDGENRVDDINYVIKQKPKVKRCIETRGDLDPVTTILRCRQELDATRKPIDPNDAPEPGDPHAMIHPTGHDAGIVAWKYCEENLPLDAPYGASVDPTHEYWRYCYLPLANYLSKHERTVDGTPDNDPKPNVPAFHQAYTWDTGSPELDPAYIAKGRLAKSQNDKADLWNIDLRVPCFVNQCDQDADNPLNDDTDEFPGFYVPFEFRLPSHLEHKVFGTDLWVEVTEISRSAVAGGGS
ncbi:MAG: hypothetical protein Q8R39_01060 [bacterium]|nr:hypothetical protein [bacterium]